MNRSHTGMVPGFTRRSTERRPFPDIGTGPLQTKRTKTAVHDASACQKATPWLCRRGSRRNNNTCPVSQVKRMSRHVASQHRITPGICPEKGGGSSVGRFNSPPQGGTLGPTRDRQDIEDERGRGTSRDRLPAIWCSRHRPHECRPHAPLKCLAGRPTPEAPWTINGVSPEDQRPPAEALPTKVATLGFTIGMRKGFARPIGRTT